MQAMSRQKKAECFLRKHSAFCINRKREFMYSFVGAWIG